MDLDLVILDNFDQEIIEITKKEETIWCVSGAINWIGLGLVRR